MNSKERLLPFLDLVQAARRRLFRQSLLRHLSILLSAACALAFVPLIVAKWKVMDEVVVWAFPLTLIASSLLAAALAWWNRPSLEDGARLIDRVWNTPELALSALDICLGDPATQHEDRKARPARRAVIEALSRRVLAEVAASRRLPALRAPKRILVLSGGLFLAVDLLLALTPQRRPDVDPGLTRIRELRTEQFGPMDEETRALLEKLRRAPDDRSLKDEARRAWMALEAEAEAVSEPRSARRLLAELRTAIREGRLTLAAGLARRLDQEGTPVDLETRRELTRLLDGVADAAADSDRAKADRARSAADDLRKIESSGGDGSGAAAALSRALDDARVESPTPENPGDDQRRRDVLLRVFSALGAAPPEKRIGPEEKTGESSRDEIRARAFQKLPPAYRKIIRDFDRLRAQRREETEAPAIPR